MEVVPSQQTTKPVVNQFELRLAQETKCNVELLNKACLILPQNYNYEIHKTVLKVLQTRQGQEYKVSLQFPEGLLMHAGLIADIITTFCTDDQCTVKCLILGDVTYGACCIDDLASKKLGCDFIVHYGHSCLVPIPEMTIKNVLYVFVEIGIDITHLVETIAFNIPEKEEIILMGIVQFNTTLLRVKQLLGLKGFSNITLPQTKPRSKGEVLGCTSPVLGDTGTVIFVGDGRFHIESSMIRNPQLTFYQYDPFKQLLTEERYLTEEMKVLRGRAIEEARNAKFFGIILGTLGRQGSTNILQEIQALLKRHNLKYFVVLMSEIFPAKLAKFNGVDAWIQIACPRLSIDWGHHFPKPLLSTFEAFAMLREADFPTKDQKYPMDFYSDEGGQWSNYWQRNQEKLKHKKTVKIQYE